MLARPDAAAFWYSPATRRARHFEGWIDAHRGLRILLRQKRQPVRTLARRRSGEHPNMTWLAIKLFLRGTLGKAWGWLSASSVHLLLAALAIALAWGAIEHHSAAKWHRALKSTETAYKSAQAEAKRAQDASDMATAARYANLAKESEHEHANAVAVVQSAADRYAASHTVARLCRPAASGTSGAGPPDLSGNPPPSDSSSGSADMVAVTRPDFDSLTKGPPLQATERGNFLSALIDAGYAIVGD